MVVCVFVFSMVILACVYSTAWSFSPVFVYSMVILACVCSTALSFSPVFVQQHGAVASLHRRHQHPVHQSPGEAWTNAARNRASVVTAGPSHAWRSLRNAMSDDRAPRVPSSCVVTHPARATSRVKQLDNYSLYKYRFVNAQSKTRSYGTIYIIRFLMQGLYSAFIR